MTSLLSLLGCITKTVIQIAPCTMAPTPTVGVWTDPYDAGLQGGCDRDTDPWEWAIYDGRVDAIEGQQANLSFRKTPSVPDGGSGPSVNVHWMLLEATDEEPDCVDAQADRVVTDGIWDAGVPELVVDDVDVWESQAALDSGTAGETKRRYLVTDGGDEAGVRRWWQRNPLVFERVCPEDSG